MLQHQTKPTEEHQASAQERVTPEELAKALAAIEARKEQSAQETANTIPIGEAIRQLGFDASTDEIWAEVQAQRQGKVQTLQTRLPRKTRRRLWFGVFAGLLALVGIGFASLETGTPTVDTESQTNISAQYIPPPRPQTVIKTLAEISNHGTFYCDAATTNEIIKGPIHAAHILVTDGSPTTGEQGDTSWVFTKHDGKLYLHGFTAPRSAAAMQQGSIPIFNEQLDETGTGGLNYSQPVLLPLGKFTLVSFDGLYGGGVQRITVSNIESGVG